MRRHRPRPKSFRLPSRRRARARGRNHKKNQFVRAADPSSEGRAAARPTISLSASTKKSGTRGSTSLREGDGRRHPIHLAPLEKHNRSIIIFVTCSSAKRKPLLAI